jgi:hypothetical protein
MKDKQIFKIQQINSFDDVEKEAKTNPESLVMKESKKQDIFQQI